jgi:hypothetical protein
MWATPSRVAGRTLQVEKMLDSVSLMPTGQKRLLFLCKGKQEAESLPAQEVHYARDFNFARDTFGCRHKWAVKGWVSWETKRCEHHIIPEVQEGVPWWVGGV